MFKTFGLWLAMNVAIMVIITIIATVLKNVFGIDILSSTSGYTGLLVYSAIIGFSGSFISLAISKWMAKRAYKMTFITKENLGDLDKKEKVVWDTILELSNRNGINIPEIGIYEDIEPNAFATGPSKNNSLVAVSTGLLSTMDEKAIEGVIAHEMAHVINGDMVTMTLLQGVLNTFVVFISNILANLIESFVDEKFSWLARLGVLIVLQILLGILAQIIANKFSRYREFRADEGSARFVGKEKMIAGLEALKRLQNLTGEDEGSLATMKISTKNKGGIMSLFSTHPSLDDRIKALEELRI